MPMTPQELDTLRQNLKDIEAESLYQDMLGELWRVMLGLPGIFLESLVVVLAPRSQGDLEFREDFARILADTRQFRGLGVPEDPA